MVFLDTMQIAEVMCQHRRKLEATNGSAFSPEGRAAMATWAKLVKEIAAVINAGQENGDAAGAFVNMCNRP